jgi:hypothetical protein
VALEERARERGDPALPAYLKLGGRENNLALAFLGLVVVGLLRGSQAAERRPHPLLAPAFALFATLHFRPPDHVLTSAERAAAIADSERVVAAVREADAAGEKALLLLTTIPWIVAGHRDVPHDRVHSAVELVMGRFPEAEGLFEHVGDGRYATVVASGGLVGGASSASFDLRLRETLDRRYDLVYPRGATNGRQPGVAIFRLRPAH